MLGRLGTLSVEEDIASGRELMVDVVERFTQHVFETPTQNFYRFSIDEGGKTLVVDSVDPFSGH